MVWVWTDNGGRFMRALCRFVIATAVLASVLTATPAGAATGTSCKTESGIANLSPGVTTASKAQTLTVTLAIAGCSGGGVTAASAKLVLKEKPTNCIGLTKTGVKLSLSGQIIWSNGESSAVSGSSTTGPKTGQATLSANVTSGLFSGARVSNVLMFGQAPGGGSCTTKSPLRKLTVKSIKSFVVK